MIWVLLKYYNWTLLHEYNYRPHFQKILVTQFFMGTVSCLPKDIPPSEACYFAQMANWHVHNDPEKEGTAEVM